MKGSQSHRRHPPTSLFVLVTLATIFMYLVALAVSIPASNPYAFLVVASASLFCFIPLMMYALLAILDEIHLAIMEWEDREDALRQKKADREHYYAHRRRMRALAEKRYQHKYRLPAYRYRPDQHNGHRTPVPHHPKDSDLTDYGC